MIGKSLVLLAGRHQVTGAFLERFWNAWAVSLCDTKRRDERRTRF